MDRLPRPELTQDHVAMVLLVLLGAALLNRVTAISGPGGFILNALVLLAGAAIARFLSADLVLPFDHVIERTLFVTLAGMLAAALALLLLLGRHDPD